MERVNIYNKGGPEFKSYDNTSMLDGMKVVSYENINNILSKPYNKLYFRYISKYNGEILFIEII